MITAIEKEMIMDEVVEGFKIMVDTVEELDKLASNPTDENVVAGQLLAFGLDMVTTKVNGLLGVLYNANETDVIAELRERVAVATKGKEHFVVVALMLVSGGIM